MIRYGAILGLAAGIIAVGDAKGQALLVTAPMIVDPAENGPGPGAIDLRPGPTGPARSVAKDRAPSGNPLWAVPLKSLSVTRERPIFSPSRRPPPPPVIAAAYAAPAQPPAPKPAEQGPPLLSLVGTIVGDSESIGIFLDQATKAVVRIRTGQDHAGWILRSVRGREATFDKDQRTATFTLPAPGTEAPPPGMERAGQPAWTDGDGQIISPPPAKPSLPVAPSSPTAVQ
jgi:general secretion pathway protein N